jgi:serine/threonine protein kinase
MIGIARISNLKNFLSCLFLAFSLLQLCTFAQESSKRCYWRVQTVSSDGRIGRLESDTLKANVRTEMSYYFETDGVIVFIVGYSFSILPFKRKILQFIYGMAYSIYIAAYGLDDVEDEALKGSRSATHTSRGSLDEKAFNPRPFSSMASLSSDTPSGRGRAGSNAELTTRQSTLSVDSTAAGVWQSKPSVGHSLDKLQPLEGNTNGIGTGSKPVPILTAPNLASSPKHGQGSEETGMMTSLGSDSQQSQMSFHLQVDRARAGSSAHVNQLVQEKSNASPGTSPYESSARIEAMNRGEMVSDEVDSNGEGRNAHSPPISTHGRGRNRAPSTDTTGTAHTYYGESPAVAGSYEDNSRGFASKDMRRQIDGIGSAPPPPQSSTATENSTGAPSPPDSFAAPAGKDLVIVQSTTMPPTWDPVDPFSYPIGNIPVKNWVPDNLEMEHFTEIQYIADGSNSNVFLARLSGEKVVIKMIREDIQHDPVAVHEFDVEHGTLARVSHPNIIKLMGAGRRPRRFIVLEWLGGGTLNSILNQHQVKSGLAQKLFRRPSFTYQTLLLRARDIAEALRFLHSHCHVGASIIHRDLKPDNVGFNSAGELKLFDFGLSTCVKLRANVNEAYEMTGNTGSLRYMAPEIALKKPYNEKADVYSFCIMLWQMAKDKVPFKGMTREDFMTNVVIRGERPKLDKSWPRAFSNMLVKSWDPDHRMRPSFAELVDEIGGLLGAANWQYGSHSKEKKFSGASSSLNSKTASTASSGMKGHPQRRPSTNSSSDGVIAPDAVTPAHNRDGSIQTATSGSERLSTWF